MLVRIEPLKSFIAARSLLSFYRHDNYSDAAGLSNVLCVVKCRGGGRESAPFARQAFCKI